MDGSQAMGYRKAASIAATTLIGAASVGLLLWVAPLSSIIRQLGHMNVWWITAAVAFEIASCFSYPVVFRRFFPEPPRGISSRVAWIAMGAGAILPGGDISSAAATGLMLRKHGIGATRLASRCVSLMTLLILFGFVVNGAAALWLLVGLPGGPHSLLKAGGPLLVSIIVLGGSAALMLALRRRKTDRSRILRIAGDGIDGAWAAGRKLGFAVLGSAGFLLLDIGALWATAMGTGHPIPLPALMLAYFIGYLATMIPVPAGIGVLDSGLAGCLVLYGMNPAASVGAVLMYHLIAIWVPACGGLIAWAPVRRAAVSSCPAPSESTRSAAAGSSDPPSVVVAASASAA